MSQTPFKIGSVYRQRNGEVVRLDPYSNESSFAEGYGSAVAVKNGMSRGSRHLSSGKVCAFGYEGDTEFTGDLLPGELTFVDGEWKSASELFIVDSKTPTLDKIEAEKEEDSFKFYDEGWNAAHDGMPFNPSATRDWRDGWNDYQDAGPEHKIRLDDGLGEAVRQATTREPARPALDWNKPADTNRFHGFTVTSHCANEPKACGLHSPDLKQSSHQVEAVFGSAELVRR